MKTVLVFAIPVILISGVGFLGMLLGALLYRAGIRHGVDLIDEHSDGNGTDLSQNKNQGHK